MLTTAWVVFWPRPQLHEEVWQLTKITMEVSKVMARRIIFFIIG